MGRFLGRGREWVSRLENGKGEFSDYVQLKIEELENVQSRHTHVALKPENIFRPGTPPGLVLQETGPDKMVASRIAPVPGAPSTRLDCENLFAELLDAAARSGNPNAFPVVYDWIKNNFPAYLRDDTPPQP